MRSVIKKNDPKKSDDVVPGQREIDIDSSEVVGEESFSKYLAKHRREL